MKTIKLTNTQLRKLIKEAIGESRGTVKLNIVVEIDAEDMLADTDDFKIGTLSAKLEQVISEINLEDQLMQEFTDVDGTPVVVRSVTVKGL